MKLAVSCIAWEPDEDDEIAGLLSSLGVHAIEAVPPRIDMHSHETIEITGKAYRERWSRHGISIPAMQALLFGHPEFSVFQSDRTREELLSFLKKVFLAGSVLGVTRYVFGSPKNRLRGDISMQKAMDVASEFFRAAGNEAASKGGCLCIEANPAEYGCDFITTTDEAAELVRKVDREGFGLHLDTGGISMTGDDPVLLIKRYAPLIRHFHVSAPQLNPIYQYESELGLPRIMDALYDSKYAGCISIEMKKSPPTREHITDAIEMLIPSSIENRA